MNEEMFQDELFNLPSEPEEGAVQQDEPLPPEPEQEAVPGQEEEGAEGTEGTDVVEDAEDQMPPAEEGETQVPPADTAQPQVDPAQLIEILVKLQNENNELKNAIQQQSQVKEETIVEALQPPTLDYDKLMYADDDARKDIEADFASKMGEYIRATTLKDMEPMLNEYRESKERRAYDEAINELKGLPDISDKFGGSLDGAMDIIGMMPALKQMKAPEAIITAALIAKGKDALNAPKRTPEQIAEEALRNPEVMKLLELKRVEASKSAPQVPAMAASHGALDAAPLNLPKKPTSFDEAFEALDKIYNKQ